jgi:hypothetical protein
MISIPEHRDFLLSQRHKGRPRSNGPAKLVETRRRQRAQKCRKLNRNAGNDHRRSLQPVEARYFQDTDSSSSAAEITDESDGERKGKKIQRASSDPLVEFWWPHTVLTTHKHLATEQP